ncbi:MAG: transposase [Magnetococcales bacterium]|nr:transposase [Magnetococcales bacterium]
MLESAIHGLGNLNAYATGSEARHGIGEWFRKYNAIRLHESLGYRTPDQIDAGIHLNREVA